MKTTHQPNAIDQLKKGLGEKRFTARSLIAFLIFGMIVLAFVLSDFTGKNSGSMGMGAAAEVNGEIVSIKDFQDEENRLSQYYAQLFGGQFDMGSQRAYLRSEVMNTIVTKTLASQASEKEGIFATDAEVRHMITEELPYFKKDGVFQSDVYKSLLTANKMSPAEFENKLRQDIKNQRSRQLFETALGVGQLQTNFEKELRAAKINLDYVGLSLTEYEQNQNLTQDSMDKKLAEPDFKKKVEDDFKARQGEYETKEQVRASHILIKADAQNEAQAKAKAEQILKRLQKEDFAKVAAKESEDPGSKAQKGDLGFFTRGRMVKEFEEAAFTLPVGKISGLIKTQFGFHIIKVTEKKAFAKADFEKAKYQIAKKMILTDKYNEFVKTVETQLAAGKTDEVVQLLKEANFKWKETGFFDMSVEVVPGLNSAQAMKTALELSASQPVAKKLVREGDVQFLVKFKQVKSETSDIKKQDQQLLERQRSSEAYRGWVNSFKKSAKIQTNSGLLKE